MFIWPAMPKIGGDNGVSMGGYDYGVATLKYCDIFGGLKRPAKLVNRLDKFWQSPNSFCQQRWANYCLVVLVQPMYVHTCGTSTVNLAKLVFLGASNAEILAFDRAHKEIWSVHGNRVKLQIGYCIGLWAGDEPTTSKWGSSTIRAYTRCAWAGGTESQFVVIQLCCFVIFWFWREIGFGFTYLRT